MKQVFQWLKICLPFVENAAETLQDLDSNKTGKDDQAADFLKYVAFGIKAILLGQSFPPPPKIK